MISLILLILLFAVSGSAAIIFRHDILSQCKCGFHLTLFIVALPSLLLVMIFYIPYHLVKKTLQKGDG